MNHYQDLTRRVAADARRSIVGLWRAQLPREAFVTAGATVVAQHAAKAWTLADVAVAAAVSQHHGHVAPFTGAAPNLDPGRLSDALSTLLDRQDARDLAPDVYDTDTEARLARLAGSETLSTGRSGYVDALRAQNGIIGWQRVLSPGACELCQEWADAGTFPTTVEPLDHANCSCTTEPVFAGEGDS